jgi:hypothetical protein
MVKNKIDFNALYQKTSSITPLADDCGRLCGSICCLPDKENSLGIYLLPGEETMFTGNEDWLQWELRHPEEDDFPSNWVYPVYFLRCLKPCPRDRRPLSCRFFPLAPHLLPDNTLLLIYETLPLPYSCPLIENKIPLKKDFITTVAACWQELLKEPRIRALVEMDSRDREKACLQPIVLWLNRRKI